MPRDKCLSIDILQPKMNAYLANYIQTKQSQAFATFVISQLIKM